MDNSYKKETPFPKITLPQERFKHMYGACLFSEIRRLINVCLLLWRYFEVQEIPRQWYEDGGVIVGPVLHITCSPEIQLLDPATITIPISLQDKNEFTELSSGNVRVLVNSYEEDENETSQSADWEEITSQLPRPADLTNGVVTFQVTHFSW